MHWKLWGINPRIRTLRFSARTLWNKWRSNWRKIWKTRQNKNSLKRGAKCNRRSKTRHRRKSWRKKRKKRRPTKKPRSIIFRSLWRVCFENSDFLLVTFLGLQLIGKNRSVIYLQWLCKMAPRHCGLPAQRLSIFDPLSWITFLFRMVLIDGHFRRTIDLSWSIKTPLWWMLWSPKSSIKCIRNCWKYEEAVGHIFTSGVSFSPVELNISICWYGWNLKKTCANLVTHWKPFIGTKITIINYLKKSWIVRMRLNRTWVK